MHAVVCPLTTHASTGTCSRSNDGGSEEDFSDYGSLCPDGDCDMVDEDRCTSPLLAAAPARPGMAPVPLMREASGDSLMQSLGMVGDLDMDNFLSMEVPSLWGS